MKTGSWLWCCLATVLTLTASSAEAEWRWVELSQGYLEAGANGVSAHRQVGWASRIINGVTYGGAVTWSGTPSSVRFLQPAGASDSYATATTDTQQVGVVVYDPSLAISHAALWSGTAASFVDLNPSWSFQSWAYGISGSQIVGSADGFAGIWTGSAKSFVGVHPDPTPLRTWDASYLYGTDGTTQVGCVVGNMGWDCHAALWHGSKETFADLHPDGWMESVCAATAGSQQVGTARTSGGYDHACLWTGSAESFVDLQPAGALMSRCLGTSGSHQVGWIWDQAGNTHAALWTGTPESFVDLSALLPWGGASANAVWEDDYAIYVVGDAGGRAVLWYNLKKMRVAPPPIKLR